MHLSSATSELTVGDGRQAAAAEALPVGPKDWQSVRQPSRINSELPRAVLPSGSLRGSLAERQPAIRMDGFRFSQRLPPAYTYVRVACIELDPITVPAGLLGCNEGGAATEKRIEHNGAACRGIAKRVNAHFHVLRCGVFIECFGRGTSRFIGSGVNPYVGPVPAVLSKLHIVELGLVSFAEDAD